MPSTASTTKYSSITGPNSIPTLPTPRDWIAKRPTRMPTAIGMTKLPKLWLTTSRPSTAVSTDMAGVIMLSP